MFPPLIDGVGVAGAEVEHEGLVVVAHSLADMRRVRNVFCRADVHEMYQLLTDKNQSAGKKKGVSGTFPNAPLGHAGPLPDS